MRAGPVEQLVELRNAAAELAGKLDVDGQFYAEQNARLVVDAEEYFHIDETRAVEPPERTSEWERGELPETYPWGV